MTLNRETEAISSTQTNWAGEKLFKHWVTMQMSSMTYGNLCKYEYAKPFESVMGREGEVKPIRETETSIHAQRLWRIQMTISNRVCLVLLTLGGLGLSPLKISID